MLRRTLIIAAALGLALAAPAMAETLGKHPHKHEWTFAGPFGKFDQAQLQRGFKVYQEVCASCHSINLLSFRNLAEKHGPFYDAKYPNPTDNPIVKQIATDWAIKIDEPNTETGDIDLRAPTSADRFPNAFPNEYAARAANGGSLPPDLSVITKARHGGADYIYALLTGYAAAPEGLTKSETQHYNPYFPGDLASSYEGKGEAPIGGLIAMPPPLTAGKVTFDDGAPSTLSQQSKDVAAFLTWASEPKQTERKQTGLAVMIYLVLLAGLAYASYRRVWRNESH